MGETGLPRLGALPAAGECRLAGGMVRLAKGRTHHQPSAVQQPGHRVDHRHFQRLGRRQVGQQAGQARRQHRLAGTGRADQQDIVPPGRGDLDAAPRRLHAAHFGKIGHPAGLGEPGRLRRGEHLGATEMVDQPQQIGRGQHLDLARPGRLAALGRRADQPEPARRGADRRWQHPGHRIERAIQGKLAQGGELRHVLARQHLHGGQYGERDGQVEMAAFLQQVGRRQVDQHALRRQSQAHGRQRGAHPLARFANRFVRQADHQERGQSGGNLYLHLHRHRLDAGEGEGLHAGDGHCDKHTAGQGGAGSEMAAKRLSIRWYATQGAGKEAGNLTRNRILCGSVLSLRSARRGPSCSTLSPRNGPLRRGVAAPLGCACRNETS